MKRILKDEIVLSDSSKTVKVLANPYLQAGAFFEIPENVEHELHALVDSYLYLIK
ncbi:MAG: hypothetical protein HUU57_12280 [Bdellovibrio sp.]|nr:hypothetical protein [Bdellovibrio sp.]